MDLNWLMDFDCLARTLSFTRAADERNITQSAFSRRIKALESWVGSPLINRDTYPVQLSEAGQQFLPVALAVIGDLSETRSSIRDSERGDARFVRFSALHTISANFLAARIEKLQEENPDLRTRVISDSLSTCCDLLAQGAVDVLLCYFHRTVSSLVDEASFERRDLASDPLLPVAASERVHTHGWDLSRQDVGPIPYLAYERSSFLGMVVEDIVGRKQMNAEIIYVDALVETIKRRVLKGSGFAWLPETAIAAELEDDVLVPIGDASWRAELTISALSDPTAIGDRARDLWQRL